MLEYIENESDSDTCIIFLHGYGANMHDLFGIGQFFPDTKIVSFQAPDDLGPMAPGGRAWFSLEFTPSGIEYNELEAQMALEELTAEVKKLRGKYKRLLVFGFSQGSIMAHGMILNNPGLFDAAICTSGRFGEFIFKEELMRNVKGFPIFISHGKYDQVIPVKLGREIISFYKKADAKVTSHIYEMMHEINEQCLGDIVDWYEALKKKDFAAE